MPSWTEEQCNALVQQMLEYMNIDTSGVQLKWCTRVAFSDEEGTELRMVAKVCMDTECDTLRIENDAEHIRREQINFQRLLYQHRMNVPALKQVRSCSLEDQVTVTASLEEWLDGEPLSGADLVDYATLLGQLHACSKRMVSPFTAHRNHLLYDTQRMKAEMEDRLPDTTARSQLIEAMTTLMRNTQAQMKKRQRFPVHGDYATNNLIRQDGFLFLIDFGRSGNGYLPEEAGEAFAEMASSCFTFSQWREQLEIFLTVYEEHANAEPGEIVLTRAVAAIAMVIRILLSDQSTIQRETNCSEILKGVQTLL